MVGDVGTEKIDAHVGGGTHVGGGFVHDRLVLGWGWERGEGWGLYKPWKAWVFERWVHRNKRRLLRM